MHIKETNRNIYEAHVGKEINLLPVRELSVNLGMIIQMQPRFIRIKLPVKTFIGECNCGSVTMTVTEISQSELSKKSLRIADIAILIFLYIGFIINFRYT